MQEMRVWSLGWKDPLEWQMATDSSILAWRIPQIEEPSRLQPMGSKESYMTEHSSTTVIVDLQRFVKVLSKVLSYIHMCVCVCVSISHWAQLCLTLCDPMDCSLPGSSVHRIFQAKIPEWVAMPSSRKSSQPRDQTWVSCIAGRFFTV